MVFYFVSEKRENSVVVFLVILFDTTQELELLLGWLRWNLHEAISTHVMLMDISLSLEEKIKMDQFDTVKGTVCYASRLDIDSYIQIWYIE